MWSCGLPSGCGTFTWSSGYRYEGEWVDGKMTGEGSFSDGDGILYVGDFKDGIADSGLWFGKHTRAHVCLFSLSLSLFFFLFSTLPKANGMVEVF